MPHVVDIDEEKQPFLSSESINDDLNNSSAAENFNHLHHHHNNQLNSQFNHHSVVIHQHDRSDDNKDSFSSKAEQNAREARAQYIMKVVAALFYAVASFLITVVNKIVLTSYKYVTINY